MASVKACTPTPMLWLKGGVLEIANVLKVLLGDPTLAGAVVLALAKPVPNAQYMIVI